jgi:hypothetical protein
MKRFLIVLSYLGLGPVLWLLLRKREAGSLKIHARNTIVLFGLLFSIVLLFGFLMLIDQVMIIKESNLVGCYFNCLWIGTWGLVRIWVAGWFVSLIGAVLSKYAYILPGLQSLNRSRWFCVFSLCGYFVVLLLIVVLAYLYQTNPAYISYEGQQSAAYALYDDMYHIDPQLAGIPFYWLAREVKAKWGQKLVILPLTDETVKLALENAIVVVVWTHGSDGKIWLYSSKRWLPFEYFRTYPKPRLKFIYFSACKLGKGEYEQLWNETFRGARIKLFKRDSAELEHILWNLFEGPAIVRDL